MYSKKFIGLEDARIAADVPTRLGKRPGPVYVDRLQSVRPARHHRSGRSAMSPRHLR